MTADTPRKFQGVWIPAERWLDRTLSPNEKVMLGEISSLETGPRGCYATNAHFAEFFDLSISRVSEIISGLVDKGHLRVELIRERKRVVERRLRLVDPFGFPNTPSEKTANPLRKTRRGAIHRATIQRAIKTLRHQALKKCFRMKGLNSSGSCTRRRKLARKQSRHGRS